MKKLCLHTSVYPLFFLRVSVYAPCICILYIGLLLKSLSRLRLFKNIYSLRHFWFGAACFRFHSGVVLPFITSIACQTHDYRLVLSRIMGMVSRKFVVISCGLVFVDERLAIQASRHIYRLVRSYLMARSAGG